MADVYKYDEFRQATIGVHVSKRGVDIRIQAADHEGGREAITRRDGSHSKESIFSMIKEVLAEVRAAFPDMDFLGMAMSIPGPVQDGVGHVLNWWCEGDGTFGVKELSALTGLKEDQVWLINEIEALGYGMIEVDERCGLEDEFEAVCLPPTEEKARLYPLFLASERAAVVQVANGLGVAFIIPIEAVESYRVIPCEIGHALAVASGPEEPTYAEEVRLLRFLSERVAAARASGQRGVEWEDIVSTRGLAWIAQFFGLERGVEQVCEDLEAEAAVQALGVHFRFMMRFLRVCASAFQCKNVFVNYGVFPDAPGVDASAILKRNAAALRDELSHCPRSEWLSSVGVYMQRTRKNMSSLGAAVHAHLRVLQAELEPVPEDDDMPEV